MTETLAHKISLNWNEPTDKGSAASISDYDLRYFAGASNPSNAANWVTEGEEGGLADPGTSTSLGHKAFQPGTTYQIQVRALGDAWSPWSPSLSVTTLNSYDTDYDGLLEVSSATQLNAIRWDTDADGQKDPFPGSAAYDTAFPGAGSDQCDDLPPPTPSPRRAPATS